VFQYGELGSSKVKGDQRFCKTEERDNQGVKIRLDPYYQGRSCRHIEAHCMRVMTARSAKSDNLRYVYCVFQYGIK
jgi:hypothetical protein